MKKKGFILNLMNKYLSLYPYKYFLSFLFLSSNDRVLLKNFLRKENLFFLFFNPLLLRKFKFSKRFLSFGFFLIIFSKEFFLNSEKMNLFKNIHDKFRVYLTFLLVDNMIILSTNKFLSKEIIIIFFLFFVKKFLLFNKFFFFNKFFNKWQHSIN